MRFKVMLLSAAAVLAPATVSFAQVANSAPTKPAQAAQTAKKPPASVKEVVVTGDSTAMRSSIDKRSYSMANDLQATSGSVADALRSIPSVDVDVQGNVSLRGDANVTIMIDGKPSGLFKGENRGDALQQLPADRIDRVEVMTNPSAAYSPEGTAGVINLITKKSKKPGRTVSVRANAGTGGRYNGGVSASYNKDKLTLSADAGVRHDAFDGEMRIDRGRPGLTPSSRQRGSTEGRGDGRNLRGGIDYDLTSVDRISGELRWNRMKFRADNEESYQAVDAGGVPTGAFTRDSVMAFGRENTAGDVTWRRHFGDEHELVSDFSLEHTEGHRGLSGTRVPSLPAGPAVYEAVDSRQAVDQAHLKLDYSRPLSGGAKLKTGLDVARDEDSFDNTGIVGPDRDHTVVDPAQTNTFLYNQTVSAVYGTYERPLGAKLTAQAGLRLEQVNTDYNQVTSHLTGANDYFKAYPTLHLAYQLTDKQQLSASYSKRVQRPQPQDLNPYVVRLDPFNLRSGNPDLKPQITDSYEAGWQFRAGQTFYLATAYYRQTRDGFSDVVQDLGGGVLLTTRGNVAQTRAGGLELVANGRLTKTLTYNLSGNAYWNEIEGSPILGTQTREGTSLGGRGSLNWQVTPKDFLQVNGFVMGQRLTAQGYSEPSGMLNLGWRHKFDDKLAFVATAQDVLGTFRQRTVVDTPALHDVSERRMNIRGVFVGLTYTFGDKPKRQKEGFDFDAGAGAPN